MWAPRSEIGWICMELTAGGRRGWEVVGVGVGVGVGATGSGRISTHPTATVMMVRYCAAPPGGAKRLPVGCHLVRPQPNWGCLNISHTGPLRATAVICPGGCSILAGRRRSDGGVTRSEREENNVTNSDSQQRDEAAGPRTKKTTTTQTVSPR